MTDNISKKIQENLIDKLEKAGGIYAPNIEHKTSNWKFFASKVINESVDYNTIIHTILDDIKNPRFVFFLKTDILKSVVHLDPLVLRGVIHYDRIEVNDDNRN